jgi:hypothetical protein
MRFKNETLGNVAVTTCTLPRKDGHSLRLRVAPLPYGFDTDFNKILKIPAVPFKTVIEKGVSKKVEMPDDPGYKAALDEYDDLRMIYIFRLSLRFESDLDWDNGYNTPDDLRNLRTEIIDSGFTQADVITIIRTAMDAGKFTDETRTEIEGSF